MNFLKNKSQELEQKQQSKDTTEEHLAYIENITACTDVKKKSTEFLTYPRKLNCEEINKLNAS